MTTYKINDLTGAAGSDTMQFETDIGGATANKIIATALATYVNSKAQMGMFNVKDPVYGAKGDGMKLVDGTTTSGSTTVSSASYTFVAGDVGKCIVIFNPNNLLVSTGAPRTIASVSAGNAVLTASTGITNLTGNAIIYFGTDDTAAIQAAVSAANPNDQLGVGHTWIETQGGTVLLPAGMYMITAPIIWYTCVSMKGVGQFSSTLYWISSHTMAATGYEAIVTGLLGNGSTRIYTDCEFTDFGMDLRAGYTTAYSYTAKHFDILNMIRPRWSRLFLQGSPATSIGVDNVCNAICTDCIFSYCGHLWNGGGAGLQGGGGGTGGGSCIDWQTNQSFSPGNFESHIIANNVFLFPGRSAARNTDLSTSTVSNFHRVIANNLVISNKTNNYGFEDDGGIGVIITGNQIHCTATQTVGFGIGSSCGTFGIISNNYISGFFDGISIFNDVANSTINPDGNTIHGNTIHDSVNFGIKVLLDSPITIATLHIKKNYVRKSGSAGIAFVNAGTSGVISNLVLSNNTLENNALTTATDINKSGILISDTVTGAKISDNYCFDNGSSTQKYGLTISTGVTVSKAMVTNNHVNDNTTQSFNIVGTLTGAIRDNYGDNTCGPTQTSLSTAFASGNIF